MREVVSVPRAYRSYIWFWVTISLIYTLGITWPELSSLPLVSLKDYGMAVAQWIMISIGSFTLIGLLSLNRVVFALLFTPLLVLSAVIAFFSVTIGTGLTATAIEIALVNDAKMWFTMTSMGLTTTVITALIVGVGAAVIRWKYVTFPSARVCLRLTILFIGVLSLPLLAPQRLKRAIGARMPYAIYFAFQDYFANRYEILSERHAFDTVEAVADSDGPDVILVIGESLRADHLPMNGYARNTMPNVSADSAVISLPNMRGHAFHTHAALPLILTRAGNDDKERAYEEPSFITLFKKAGFNTAWFANQDLGSSYAYFAHEADTLIYTNSSRSLYVYSQWLDLDILEPFEQWLDKTGSGNQQMAVLHTIGSHWWYKSHYTDDDACFSPDISSKDIGSQSQEQIINAYDNTIIATDRFLSRLFSLLSDRNAIVIYVSDHGEALGENGIYFHGTDHDVIHNPACLVWTSPEYAQRYASKIEALNSSRLSNVSTDAIFHTMLDAGMITTQVKDLSLSLLHDSVAD